MEKLVRYRKAFYEKENDHKNGNKRKETGIQLNQKSFSTEKLYQSVPQLIHRQYTIRKKDSKSNTAAFCDQYAQDILNSGDYYEKSKRFLRKHQIDGSLRARMLDWMVEVTTSYKFSSKTYFDGMSIMDRYFEFQTEPLNPNKLHIIGVQSMLIASKMEEVFPLKLKTVYQKIGHKKISQKELVEMEETISKRLDFKLNSWTFYDLAMLKILQFIIIEDQESRSVFGELHFSTKQRDQNEGQSQKIKKAEEICSYLAKFICYDYDFYCESSMMLLSEILMKATFELMGISCNMVGIFTNSPIIIEINKQKLYKIIKNFKLNFPGLTNINKFTRKEIINQVEEIL